MFRNFLLLLVAGIAFTSCEDELKVNADWKDVSIIYGVLDKTKNTNYVRIHRGYLGDEGITGGNQNPDSLYYPELSVTIDVLFEGQSFRTITLQKDESIDLDSGYFTTEDYHTYRVDGVLHGNDSTYLLNVDKEDDNLDPVYAETPLVEDFDITRPRAFQSLNFAPIAQKLNWDYAKNGRMYQAVIRFHYLEMQRADHTDTTRHYIDYVLPIKVAENLDGDREFKTEISYETFYNFLANKIEINQDVMRFYRGSDIMITAVADDLATYMNVNAPAGTVIQDRPHFTNISGGDGSNAGIFSSSNQSAYWRMDLNNASFDSLVLGNLTCELQFAKKIALDTCFCQNGFFPTCD